MAHYNFDKDLIDGLDAENSVKSLLKKKYKVSDDDIVSSTTKEFDIKIKSLNLTFEVKNDLMAEKTGNIAIEFESRGKPSGVSTTKADYWVYKFSNMFYIIERTVLVNELVNKGNYSRIVNGGDYGSNTMMYLVKVEAFKSWGEKL
ncbi:MAG: hypothetical protein COZ18_06480 [Flexibacter sp. CG_4_10_14_3_um_filter_32_15]|nr:MAG: hypothetical protein COZ18_06480 [Flexibacter sp. CG_4_10_14_3_um_filter_32_15]